MSKRGTIGSGDARSSPVVRVRAKPANKRAHQRPDQGFIGQRVFTEQGDHVRIPFVQRESANRIARRARREGFSVQVRPTEWGGWAIYVKEKK